MSHHNVVIIGGGPGGYGAALYAASAGLDVALVEMNKVGGTCLHVGCIPAKELLETATVFRTVQHAAEFGVSAGAPALDMTKTQARKQAIVDQLAGGVAHLLKNRKVTVYNGVGTLGPNKTVTVSDSAGQSTTITGDHVILAAGSTPRSIPGFDIDGVNVVTSDHVLSLDSVPKRVAIIGGGAIGCEFASMLLDVGSEVTLLEYMPTLVPGVDKDAAKVLARAFSKRGMNIKTGVKVENWESNGFGLVVNYGTDERVEVDLIVVSVGRRPLSDYLGLQGTDVAVDDRGFIVTNDDLLTAEPGVYAVGDVINTAQLAHVAFAEAIYVIKHILGESPVPVDYANVPWCIYSHPEVAFAGLTEEQAREAGWDVIVSKHRYNGNSRAIIIGEAEGLVKVIAEKLPDGTGGRILGVHMAGPWVTEQLGQAYIAINWEATVQDVAQFIQPHPTLSELYGETVLGLTGRSLH